MSNQPPPEEINKWHRWFAVECNNRAWDLASQAERSDAEDREMLSAAYAAAFHWSKAGQPINDARADVLLAHAHALLGQGSAALQYAQRSLTFCESNECEDWDLAFAHSEMTFAYAASGDDALHAQFYASAEEKGKAIADEEERKVFFEEFGRIPKSKDEAGMS